MVEDPSKKRRSALDDWCLRLLKTLDAPAGRFAQSQADGRERLGLMPAPHRHQEDWRFCDLASLVEIEPRQIDALSQPKAPHENADVTRLVLGVDQGSQAEGSLPPGVSFLNEVDLQQLLGQTLKLTNAEEHWPVALNQALVSQVIGLRVSGVVDKPVELVFDAGSDEGVMAARLLLVLEEKASIELLQVHMSSGSNLNSVVIEAQLKRGAHLHHGLLAFGHTQAALLSHLAVEQEPTSKVTLVSASHRWGVMRHEPQLTQLEGGAESELRALQLVQGDQLADTHSLVCFKGTEGSLDQLHKAVADGNGRSVFNGMVDVPREAQRTKAAQLSRSLLLSDKARIDTKPELEIVADDVKCTHGATVSRLQQEELFYLQSRGVGPAQASQLLLRAFCDDVLSSLPSAAKDWQPVERLLDEA